MERTYSETLSPSSLTGVYYVNDLEQMVTLEKVLSNRKLVEHQVPSKIFKNSAP